MSTSESYEVVEDVSERIDYQVKFSDVKDAEGFYDEASRCKVFGFIPWNHSKITRYKDTINFLSEPQEDLEDLTETYLSTGEVEVNF